MAGLRVRVVRVIDTLSIALEHALFIVAHAGVVSSQPTFAPDYRSFPPCSFFASSGMLELLLCSAKYGAQFVCGADVNELVSTLNDMSSAKCHPGASTSCAGLFFEDLSELDSSPQHVTDDRRRRHVVALDPLEQFAPLSGGVLRMNR